MQFFFKVSNDCNSAVLIITVMKMLIQYNTEGYSRNIETLVMVLVMMRIILRCSYQQRMKCYFRN